MKDEIKEIINDLQRVADRKCYPEDVLDSSIAQEWVDYITNLQERNEKAIEYIKQHTEKRVYKEPYNIYGFPDRVEYFIKGKWNLLDILQGEDKDE